MIEYPRDFFDLCYHNTDTPIQLGDHVIYSKWFGLKKIASRVCFIPGISAPNKAMEDTEKSCLWAIEDGGHDIIQMLYVQNDKFVSKKIQFVKRSSDNYKGLQPNEALA